MLPGGTAGSAAYRMQSGIDGFWKQKGMNV
jgi:hypothetical protein